MDGWMDGWINTHTHTSLSCLRQGLARERVPRSLVDEQL